MAIVSSSDILTFLGIEENYFIVNASNDVLKLKYDSGAVTDCDVADGTYNGDSLATIMKTTIDAALTCTSTITYSSITRKFTIAVPAGHTITYTHSGSDLGLTIGFNQDHAAALSITSDVEAGDPTELVEIIHPAVEKWIKKYCNREFESTSYRERYNGTGSSELILRQYPVISLSRLSLWPLDVIRVKNTNTTTNATVSVSSTAVTLTRDGSSSTVLFADYATFTLLAAAISAVSGWSAEVVSSSYDNYKSTELIERMGLYCLESNWAYLQMPYNRGEIDFDVDSETGIINLYRYSFDDSSGFPVGIRNIFVDYVAGYATADMPTDIQLAVKILVKYMYQRVKEESLGFSSYRLGDISETFEKEGIPIQVELILNNYRRKMIGNL